MTTTVHVEPLGPDAWETFRDLRLRALLTDPDSFGSTWDDEHDGDETWWRDWLSLHRWFVARRPDGVPIGLVAAVPRAGREGAEEAGGREPFGLNGLWVDPTARGLGVAAALVGAVREAAVDTGAAAVTLTVVDGNTAARHLFSSLGFRPTGDRTPRDRHPARWNDRFVLDLL